MKNDRKVTIRDIANVLGLSKTTVSRYINGQTHLMSEKTAERIKDTIELLNYHPSDVARSLKTKKSYTVGIILSNIFTPFASSAIVGAGDALTKFGYIPLFINCHEDAEQEERAINSLIARGVDGLIINTTAIDTKFLLNYVTQGIPMVLCGGEATDYNYDIVTIDNQQVIRTLVQHLKEQGYIRVALFSQNSLTCSSRLVRWNSFTDTVQEIFGYNAEHDIYTVLENKPEDIYEKLMLYMSSLEKDDIPAVIGVDSIITVGLYYAMKRANLSMPNQIGLCGINAWESEVGVNWVDMLVPAITTVDIDAKEIGTECARVLIEKIKDPNRERSNIKSPTVFTLRQSTQRI